MAKADDQGNLCVNIAANSAPGLSSGSASSPLNSIASKYALANGINLQYAYQDDFSQGFQGWQYQYDTTGRTGITLSEEARMGNYSLQLHTRAAASDECWARKGMRLPDGLKKIIYGCYWTAHATDNHNPAAVRFECDTQSDTQRSFFSTRWLYYDTSQGGIVNKWQVNTGGSTLFTDVTNGTEEICFNESNKPMLSYMMVVLDYQTLSYDKLYSNGNVYDLKAQGVAPGTGTYLSAFNKGLVNLYVCQNRTDSTAEGIVTIEKPFLAWGF